MALTELDKKPAGVQKLLIGADYTILLYAPPDEIEPALQARIQAFLRSRQSGASASAKASPTPTTCAP